MDIEKLFPQIQSLKSQVDKIYIYGYGTYGRNLYKILLKHSISVDGFVGTRPPCGTTEIEGLPVYQASDVFRHRVAFLIAMNEKSTKEVMEYVVRYGVSPSVILDAGNYISGGGRKRGLASGSFEVVTIVGCPVQCRYCPQEKFTAVYGGGTDYFPRGRSAVV